MSCGYCGLRLSQAQCVCGPDNSCLDKACAYYAGGNSDRRVVTSPYFVRSVDGVDYRVGKWSGGLWSGGSYHDAIWEMLLLGEEGSSVVSRTGNVLVCYEEVRVGCVQELGQYSVTVGLVNGPTLFHRSVAQEEKLPSRFLTRAGDPEAEE